MTVEEIMMSDDKEAHLALFRFTVQDDDELILNKFKLWGKTFFPKYFKGKDASFHEAIDLGNLHAYKAIIKTFTDIAFRNAAKTTRTKLFLAFVIANDGENFCKYIKVLAKDNVNSTQIVTDIYNMFVDWKMREYYPEIFVKTDFKREETMGSFTTATGVKVLADTVGTDHRGALQEESRPDLIVFEDFETRKTLHSAVTTQTIWDNMEEAKNGLAKGRSAIYNCNYLSERGNVHKLVERGDKMNRVLITPIKDKEGKPTWDIYTIEEINQIEKDADDFEGEYMCKPSASLDVIFDRETLENMKPAEVKREVAGFKIYKEYDPSHRYASGHDVSGGVGLDSSTSVFIDFDVFPCRVVATYKTNSIKPDVFGYEIVREANLFGGCLVAPEQNNHGHATIAILKQEYENIFSRQNKDTEKEDDPNKRKEYGWHTNGATKPKMMFALKKAVEDGLLVLSDPDLIHEAMGFSRDDLMDKEVDPRLATRHFDLLIACAIAWQMKDYAEVAPEKEIDEEEDEERPLYPQIGV
jgi:hypothetical protein